MAPNNNVPTIQLAEVELPKHVVSEIDDTKRRGTFGTNRVFDKKISMKILSRRVIIEKHKKMKIPRNLLIQIASS